MKKTSSMVFQIILTMVFFLLSCKEIPSDPANHQTAQLPTDTTLAIDTTITIAIDTLVTLDSLTIRALSSTFYANYFPQPKGQTNSNSFIVSTKLLVTNISSKPHTDTLSVLSSYIYDTYDDSLAGTIIFKVTGKGRIDPFCTDTITLDRKSTNFIKVVNVYCGHQLYFRIQFQDRNGQLYQMKTNPAQFICVG
jgi:hypothetical protein